MVAAHRVARLVPLYWLASALYLGIVLVVPGLLSNPSRAPAEPVFVAGSFLFWPMLDPEGRAQPLYSLGWTLQCEMAFYGLFALALAFGLNRRGVFALVAGSLGLLAALHVLVTDLPMPLAFWSAPIGLEFALGAACASPAFRGCHWHWPGSLSSRWHPSRMRWRGPSFTACPRCCSSPPQASERLMRGRRGAGRDDS